MKDAFEFLRLIQEDPQFLKKAQACATDKERITFLRDGGFEFSPEEFEAAIRTWPSCLELESVQEPKERRSAKRHEVFMKVTEVNNQPVSDTIMLDISAWGARIESLIPLSMDSNAHFSFYLPGEATEEKVQLSGKVVWSGQVPISKRYQVGLQFYQSIEKMQKEGKFNIGKFQQAVQRRNERISDKSFLTIKEFADTIGVHWSTVWRWTAENRITFKQVKAGCKILIPASELLKF
ncbi:MAG: Nif11-like leader peptide family RiPP precursor [Thermodesulfobacteriota bacterium]